MSLSVLRAVLDTQPSTWTRKTETEYSNIYILVEVSRYITEYDEAINGFESHRVLIRSVQRVQNPFQWGLFQIQKEKRRSEGSSAIPTTGYHIIHPKDLHTAMKYPLDYRRYEHRNISVQSDQKHPKFYSSFRSAYDNRDDNLTDDEETIIIKCDYFDPPKNQGDYYPLYVITLSAQDVSYVM